MMRILGMETSCDDTCAAVIEAHGSVKLPHFRVLSSVVSSQTKTHAEYGGVMPTLAAREHSKNITPVIGRALKVSKCELKNIDLISVTTHPGLLPSLLIGVHAARALAWATKKPIIGINHLQGHVVASLLPALKSRISKPNVKIKFPAVALTVSGGHTQLMFAKSLTAQRIIGETRDDAAGEAFDKVGRLLGLPYPGGPHIAAEAAKILSSKSKILNSKFQIPALPRPMIDSGDYDFSFSGLKTAVLYLLRDLQSARQPIPTVAICSEFQQAVIDVLVSKTTRAAKQYNAKTIILGGGVAANKELRGQLKKATRNKLPHVALVIPPQEYTLDNAAMIAAAGYVKWQDMSASKRKTATWKNVRVKA